MIRGNPRIVCLHVVLALNLVLLGSASARGQSAPAAPAAGGEVIVEVRVHGNHTTPDADVLRLADVQVGQAFTPALLDAVAARLRASDRFGDVDVRKRFASIADLSQVVLVIVVEEREGVTLADPTPGPMRRWQTSTMWMPILRYEDGYGFTYGARVSFVDLIGSRTRISTPLTWGGERQAAVEWERAFEHALLTRVVAAGGVRRRENPAYDIGDRREFASLRLEHAFTSTLRLGLNLGADHVHFAETRDRVRTAGLDVALDTRGDPSFPRNAVFGRVAWDRVWFEGSPDTHRVRTDLRGYVGLVGQSVLVLRAQQSWAADSLPDFEQPLLGGAASLRGQGLGYRVDDRLAAGSAEIRLPLSSPIHVGRFGVAAFVDSGAVYPSRASLGSARFDTSVGGGVFIGATIVNARLDVAHALGAGTRAIFTFGVAF